MIKDNHTPLVTVGIPTYNRPKGLERTLESITQQTYLNLEIIVSDNCSTNEAILPILQQYAEKDNRVKYYIQEKNLSIVPNFQFLLDQAKGEYFMWAADDDDWDNNFIEVCVKGLQSNSDAVLCISDVKIVDFNNTVLKTSLNKSFIQNNLYSRLFNWIRSTNEIKYFFCGLYRTKVVKNIKIPNMWGSDHMFLLETLTKGFFLYLPNKSNFYYYLGGCSTTSTAEVKKSYNIQSMHFSRFSYIPKYVYYHFRFKHLNLFQKIRLFFSNSLGLIFNKDFILYYIFIKIPVKQLFKKIKK